jgi:hypothetical protein
LPSSGEAILRLDCPKWVLSLYGGVLIAAGIADGAAEIAKASGIRINLWVGLDMLILGVLLLWARLRPVRLQEPSAAAVADDRDDRGSQWSPSGLGEQTGQPDQSRTMPARRGRCDPARKCCRRP